MNKKSANFAFSAASVACFALVLLLDQLTKSSALNDQQFVLNTGIIGGMQAFNNSAVRVLFVLNTALLVSLFYLFCMFFVFPVKAKIKWVLSVLYAAILSNSIDRIRFGGVIDFIPVELSNTKIFMNVADIFQQVSVIFLMVYLTLYRDKIWKPNEKRKVLLLDPKAQLNMAGFFALITFIISLGMFYASAAYFKITYGSDYLGTAPSSGLFAVLSSFLVSTMVFTFSLFYSKKLIGPIFAIKRYFQTLDAEHPAKFELRDEDLFKHIEDTINKRNQKL